VRFRTNTDGGQYQPFCCQQIPLANGGAILALSTLSGEDDAGQIAASSWSAVIIGPIRRSMVLAQ
jgi:hypothetical protein